MIQPVELRLELPMVIANGEVSTTAAVWETLSAAYNGNLGKLRELINSCSALAYAQYNYTPPVHLAVREGHFEVVKLLLSHGAYDPAYRTYPFLEDLITIAKDRELFEIADRLNAYSVDPFLQKFKGDNGEILYNRTLEQIQFEKAVEKNDLTAAERILQKHPGYATDPTCFWSEGILMFPAKEDHREMIDLLMSYGAVVPKLLKWAQYYYLEDDAGCEYILKKAMDPNTQSWHHVTLLHDMAQKGNIKKAKLLMDAGADIDAIDEEYLSTPLALAAKWGHADMVKFLISEGADKQKAGASWSTPLAWAKKKGHIEIQTILKADY